MNSFTEERDTVEYDSLMSLANLIVIRLPGCDDEMVRKFLSQVYRDFVNRSCVLKTRRTVDLQNEQTIYHLCPKTSGCIIDCITKVFLNGFELSPSEYYQDKDSIVIHHRHCPRKGEHRTMEVECLELPRLGEENAPSWFIRKYGDAIVSGVLMQLMRMTGRAWSDPQQAALETVAYENALTEARMRHYGNATGGANYFKRGNLL